MFKDYEGNGQFYVDDKKKYQNINYRNNKPYDEVNRIFYCKYRIFPTEDQKNYIRRIAGLCRLYWNICVVEKRKNPSFRFPSYKQLFTEYKPEALAWCDELDSAALGFAYVNVKEAFARYEYLHKIGFTKAKAPGLQRKRPGSTYVHWSYQTAKKLTWEGKLLITEKLGPIDIRLHRPLNTPEKTWNQPIRKGGILNISVFEEPDGSWNAILAIKGYRHWIQNKQTIGIDWNCRDDSFLVLSNGKRYPLFEQLRREEHHLKDIQKRLTRKYIKGAEKQSNKYYKELKKLQKLHAKIKRQRIDWLHKISHEITERFDTIVIEDIDLSVMRNKGLGKIIQDQGYAKFRDMLVQKGQVYRVDPAYTSKTCSNCGFINMDVVLGVHEWTCPKCGAHHDRDINAAINIKNKYVGDRGQPKSKCPRK